MQHAVSLILKWLLTFASAEGRGSTGGGKHATVSHP